EPDEGSHLLVAQCIAGRAAHRGRVQVAHAGEMVHADRPHDHPVDWCTVTGSAGSGRHTHTTRPHRGEGRRDMDTERPGSLARPTPRDGRDYCLALRRAVPPEPPVDGGTSAFLSPTRAG